MANKQLDQQEELEAFLHTTNTTNFEIIARGNSLNGAVAPRLRMKAGQPVFASYSGHMDYGQERGFKQALNAAQGGRFVFAVETLINSYFYQVEVCVLSSISVEGEFGERPNPLAKTLPPLIWQID